MDIKDKICVVTGAASGIGKALCERFAKEGAKLVVCSDINGAGAEETAQSVGGVAYTTDVSKEAHIQHLIEDVEANHGPIDLFCSNAGIAVMGGPETTNEQWQKVWEVNTMSHIWAARHVVPRMIERGGGYLLNTASAAGLLNQIGSLSYGVTKHAAVGAAEWLAMTYGDQGIKVSVFCPQSIRTEMTRGGEGHVAAIDGMMEPEDAAEACVKAINEETFLALTHMQVVDYMQNKTANYDRWIGGMRKLNRRFAI
ncbi:MAG: SDR family oxidoreductase [Pseudomonadota bacterium]